MNNFKRIIPHYNNFKVTLLESFLFFLIVIFLGQTVAAVISAPTFFVPETSMILLPLSFLLGFGSVAFALLKIKGLGIKDVKDFLHTQINIIHVLLAIVLYIVALPLAEYLSMLVPTEGKFLGDLYDFFIKSMQIVFEQKVAAFIMVCLLAPLLEEFIFRGIILRGMIQKGINPWVAITVSGFLFGLAHMNPWQFMGAGFLGFIFGVVYWRTQSLWLVIFLHFLNNFIAYVITIYSGTLEETVFEPNYMLIIGSLFFTINLVIFLIYKTKNNDIKEVVNVE